MSPPKRLEIKLKTADGIKISAHHYCGNFKKAIIICHGFMMSKDSKPFLMLSKRLSDDFDIITMDFRGHGKSTGRYTFSAKEGLDLKAVIDYAIPKYKFIGIIGFSLGAAAAINETAVNKAISRLMVVAAPTEFERIENRFLNKDVIYSTIKKFEWKTVRPRFGNILLRKLRPIDNVNKISIPILFVHGGKDPIIKPEHSISLYKKAKDPKRLVIFEDCLHAEDVFSGDNFDNFISLCIEWFKNGA